MGRGSDNLQFLDGQVFFVLAFIFLIIMMLLLVALNCHIRPMQSLPN